MRAMFSAFVVAVTAILISHVHVAGDEGQDERRLLGRLEEVLNRTNSDALSDEQVQLLQDCFHNSCWRIRRAAFVALSSGPVDTKFIPDILAAVRDQDYRVAREAVGCIRQIPMSHDARVAIAEASSQARDPRIAASLLEIISKDHEASRIALLGDDQLLRLLDDPRVAMRSVLAKLSSDKIGDPAIMSALESSTAIPAMLAVQLRRSDMIDDLKGRVEGSVRRKEFVQRCLWALGNAPDIVVEAAELSKGWDADVEIRREQAMRVLRGRRTVEGVYVTLMTASVVGTGEPRADDVEVVCKGKTPYPLTWPDCGYDSTTGRLYFLLSLKAWYGSEVDALEQQNPIATIPVYIEVGAKSATPVCFFVDHTTPHIRVSLQPLKQK